MVSISLVKRKWKRADGTVAESKTLWAQIRFTNPPASYLRDTGIAGRKQAEKEARRLADEIEKNELPQRGKPVWTLDETFSKWILERGKELRSGKDIRWQIALILDLMGSQTLIKDIGNAAVHDFAQAARERGKSGVVVNRCLTRLRATLRYASVKWEAQTALARIDWAAHFESEPDEKLMYLSPAEARRFVEVLPPHIGLAFAFSYYTGCRLNELETLTWDKIDMPGRVAIVETKGLGKEPVYRQLRLSERALLILAQAEASGYGASNFNLVFDLTNRRKHWEAARARVGRPEITWHGIRHSFGTEASRQTGAAEKVIGAALGHSAKSGATKRYIHAMSEDVYAALASLPDIGMPGEEK